MIYRFVDVLNEAGIKAHVLHDDAAFRCTWFANSTSVVAGSTRPLCAGDLLVIPEGYGRYLADIGRGTPKVILNQAAYLTFAGWGLWDIDQDTGPNPYRDPEVVGTIAMSVDTAAYLSEAFPGLEPFRVVLSVDFMRFRPAPIKYDRIAFMPRRNSHHAEQVFQMLRCRGALLGWSVRPIDGMSESQVAQELAEARVFLSFADLEGLGLPQIEAMACECAVVGYHGMGGREYFTEETGYPVSMGDIRVFVATTEQVLRQLRINPDPVVAKVAAGADLVRKQYTRQRERASLLATFTKLLKRARCDAILAGVKNVVPLSRKA